MLIKHPFLTVYPLHILRQDGNCMMYIPYIPCVLYTKRDMGRHAQCPPKKKFEERKNVIIKIDIF